jgi:hypothetical protein
MVDVNAAMVEILRFPDRESLLGIHAASLYVNPEDRERAATGCATLTVSPGTSASSFVRSPAEWSRFV